jgi:probable rRNA maturation factor
LGKILFNNNGVLSQIVNKPDLKKFLNFIFSNENIEFKRLDYIFCNDALLLSLNQDYLNHDTFTDILTFTLSGETHPIVSEVYISIERVKENAASLNVAYSNELLRVMIHGILHLCGYCDHTPRLKKEMRKREDYYLSQLFHVKRST